MQYVHIQKQAQTNKKRNYKRKTNPRTHSYRPPIQWDLEAIAKGYGGTVTILIKTALEEYFQRHPMPPRGNVATFSQPVERKVA